jgi:hypothetical protein
LKKPKRDPGEVLADGEALDRAIVAAHRRVIIRHRQLGIPLVFWRDGRVVEVSADSVELPEYEPSHPADK